MIRIAIMKDPGIFRDGVQRVIEAEIPDCRVSSYGSAQLDILKNDINLFDLLILDTDTDTTAYQLMDQCRYQTVKIAAWISEVDNAALKALFKKGLNGYFCNGMGPNELVGAIQTVLAEEQYIHPLLSVYLLKDYIAMTETEIKRPNGILSAREWDIMEQIVQGRKNFEIAENLYISSKTVKNHLISIFKKLNVTDRTNAALLAVKNKWITL
ncbi:two-component system response regulator DegU [Barrientosiimonas marina]|uniref:DNA-binding response regulator n=1 Tax=Lentibacillus kimchii TaxID=1542911 RepID=A0ABW2UYU9_9BACI